MTQTRKRRQQNIIIEKGEKEAPAKPIKKKKWLNRKKKKRRVNEQTKRACVMGDDNLFEDCKHASLLCSTQKKVHSFS